MHLLEITEFSAGICGVWTRVLAESREFIKLGHEVTVFSSDIEKGTHKVVETKQETTSEGILIKRFSNQSGMLDKLVSKNVTHFDFEGEFRRLANEKKIDKVITHLIHPHSFKALKLCKELNIPCYLVTHAPFNVKRKFPLNLATALYYSLKVKSALKGFTKIILITDWERRYLQGLGVPDKKMVFIPNGLPNAFLSQKKEDADIKGDVLFLGRISPIKGLKTLALAAKELPDLVFSVIGPAEGEYKQEFEEFMIKEKIINVYLYPPIFDLEQKIAVIDQHQFFVLPSFREAMPQVLIEAMARGLVVLSSATDGGKEIIRDKENGFLFPIGDEKELVQLLKGQKKGNKKVQEQAKKDAKKYAWSTLIKRYEEVFKND